MVRVGVIGLGMMGLTHLDVYSKRKDARVVALSDADPDRLSGKVRAAGNIEGQAQGGFDFGSVRKYAEGKALIADRDVDLVDICLPTPLHKDFVLVALAAGKHVLVEKPLARTAADAAAMAEAARKAKGFAMCALCMRFWPGWTWLKDAIAEGTYGKVRSAWFRRVATHPGGPYYSNGKASGGAILDLHIHDADFVQHCFGMPRSVFARGYAAVSGEVDHLVALYSFDGVPLVAAEGGWAMAPGFPFTMQYAVNFERATATYDLASKQPLKLSAGGKEEAVPVDPGMGYEREIDYFLGCLGRGARPELATIESAAASVRIVEAEAESIRTGKAIEIR